MVKYVNHSVFSVNVSYFYDFSNVHSVNICSVSSTDLGAGDPERKGSFYILQGICPWKTREKTGQWGICVRIEEMLNICLLTVDWLPISCGFFPTFKPVQSNLKKSLNEGNKDVS